MVILSAATSEPPPYSAIVASRKNLVVKTTDEIFLLRSDISEKSTYRQTLKEPVLAVAWSDVIPHLQSLGFTKLSFISKGDVGFNFDADRGSPCPLCKDHTHTSNNWYITRLTLNIFCVKNHSSKCTMQMINWEENPYIKSILQFPKGDGLHAELFAKIFKDHLYRTTNKRYLFFEKHRWTEMPIDRVIGTIRSVQSIILTNLIRYLSQKQYVVNTDVTTPKRQHNKELAALKRQLDAANDALRYCQGNRSLINIENQVRSECINQEIESSLDTNPNLLGVNNGVVDLQTCTYRPGCPGDFISKSVGLTTVDRFT